MRYQVLHPLESGPNVSLYLVADRRKSGASRVLTLLLVDLSFNTILKLHDCLGRDSTSLDHIQVKPIMQ